MAVATIVGAMVTVRHIMVTMATVAVEVEDATSEITAIITTGRSTTWRPMTTMVMTRICTAIMAADMAEATFMSIQAVGEEQLHRAGLGVRTVRGVETEAHAANTE